MRKKRRNNLAAGFLCIAALCAAILAPSSLCCQEKPLPGAITSADDPFKPFIKIVSEKEKKVQELETIKKKASVLLSPLEKYGIEEFKLTGVALGQKRSIAMVVDSRGTHYVLTRGTRIGLNGGLVDQILLDRVVIVEKKKDPSGKTTSERVVLRVNPEEGGD